MTGGDGRPRGPPPIAIETNIKWGSGWKVRGNFPNIYR
jgi:hypothetical protein